jgi:hypothetical protein
MLDQTLKFTEQNLSYNFFVNGNTPKIIIKRIVIDSLMGQFQQMGPKMTKLGSMLQITFYKINGLYMEAPISLNAYISPYHIQPIIDFNREFPTRNNWNMEDINDFDSCKIEIKYTPQPDIKLEVTILCDVINMQLSRLAV